MSSFTKGVVALKSVTWIKLITTNNLFYFNNNLAPAPAKSAPVKVTNLYASYT